MKSEPTSLRHARTRVGPALILALVATITSAQVYSVEILAETNPMTTPFLTSWWLNSTGHALGTVQTNTGPRGLVVSPEGHPTHVSHPLAVATSAHALNDRNWVVGDATFRTNATDFQTRAFVWTAGEYRLLPAPAPATAFGVNNLGAICGTGQVFAEVQRRAFVVAGDRFSWLPDLPSMLPVIASTHASAINDRGDVVGVTRIGANALIGNTSPTALLWRRGPATTPGALGYGLPAILHAPSRGAAAWPNDVSNRGLVAGHAFGTVAGTTGPMQFPVFWQGLTPGRLPSLGLTGAALAANDLDEIVGWSVDLQNRQRAVLWVPARPRLAARSPDAVAATAAPTYGVRDLNALIPPGLNLIKATDVNDAGQIVCLGVNASGRMVAVRLTPR